MRPVRFNLVGTLRIVLESHAVELAGAALAMLAVDFEDWVVGMIGVRIVGFDYLIVVDIVIVAGAVVAAAADVIAVVGAVVVFAVVVVVVAAAVVGIPSCPYC